MPELPEVQMVVNTLAPAVVGQRIVHVKLNRSDVLSPAGFDLPAHLTEKTIARIDRRGKRIVFSLSDANQFFIHLGMTGRLTIESAGAAIQPHTHLVIGFTIGEMRFRDPRRFGGIWWLAPVEPAIRRWVPNR